MYTIAGHQPKPPKVKVWRELEGFDPLKDGQINVEGTLEKIAMVYDLPVDTVAEELELADLLTCFLDCVKFVNGVVLEKLKNMPKNGEGDGE